MVNRKEIREALLLRRTSLTRESELARVETIELDQTRVGRLSRAEAMQDHQMSLEMARRRQAMLEAIDQTLIRIDQDPDYGLCEDCGESIAPARLALDPTQPCCVNCAGKREQR
ncbi:MAG: TraR/DksA family transcriptional regulator [Proteobacteria bacterium]|nr:TraR/DksA family transcriptional regulator [Pseudomonadota bacterium]HJP06487.1 TraR/DksA C4-type zinc finger protein [Arenicellales bacterium]